MNTNAAIEHLKSLPRISEAYHVTTFRCVREAEDGSPRKIIVELWDAGEDAGNSRYTASATSDDGRSATSGNPAGSVEAALSILHWFDFDRPPLN
jgi:hypothetical protein